MPTTEPAVAATDTAADIAMPDLQRALAAQAIAYRVARMFSDQEKALRGGNTAAMIRHHQDSGVDRLTIRVPGIDAPIAKASLAIPKATATVTDPAQLAAFVAGVAPTEVDTVLTIRVHTDMATAAIVADLTTRLEQMDPTSVSWSSETVVREAYKKALLAPKNIAGGKALYTDQESGEQTEIPGVEVSTPEPSKFSLTGWDQKAADAAVDGLFADPAGLRRILAAEAPAIAPRTVPGEVVDTDTAPAGAR